MMLCHIIFYDMMLYDIMSTHVYDMGSYDTDVSDQNWCDYLFDETPPTHINYHSSIACHYLEAKQFGYSPVKRIKQSIVEMNFEVKKYDSVLVSV